MKNEALRLSRFPEFRLSPSMLTMLRRYYINYVKSHIIYPRTNPRRCHGILTLSKHRTVWALEDRGLIQRAGEDTALGLMRISGLGLWVARNYWDLNGKDSVE